MCEVAEILRERLAGVRRPGVRLALSVEGGAMRGCVATGMVAALGRLPGAETLFDAAYGTSIGATSAAFLLAGDIENGKTAFARMATTPGFMRPFVPGRVLNLDLLFRENALRLDYAAVAASPVALHPLVTSPRWREARSAAEPHPDEPGRPRLDLNTADGVRAALQAAATLPLACALPFPARWHGLWDAAFHEPFPLQTPQRHGATHLLVLRSQPDQRPAAPHARALFSLGARAWGAESYVGHCRRAAAALDMEVAQIPAPAVPVGPLESDPSALARAVDAGEQAAEDWLQAVR